MMTARAFPGSLAHVRPPSMPETAEQEIDVFRVHPTGTMT